MEKYSGMSRRELQSACSKHSEGENDPWAICVDQKKKHGWGEEKFKSCKEQVRDKQSFNQQEERRLVELAASNPDQVFSMKEDVAMSIPGYPDEPGNENDIKMSYRDGKFHVEVEDDD